MSENNEPKRRSLFENFWSKKFLIFSFILIVIVLLAVIFLEEPQPEDPTLDQKDVLEMDSLGEMEQIRDEQQTEDYVQPEDERGLWNGNDNQ